VAPALSGRDHHGPETGEIVAMAVSPTFDLNNFKKSRSNQAVFGNPLGAKRLRNGLDHEAAHCRGGARLRGYHPETTYNDTGCIEVDQKKICNFDGVARGVIPIQQILSQSLNVGASFVATKMGPDTCAIIFLIIINLARRPASICRARATASLNNIETAKAVEYDTASFGQGIAITPIETVRALATLANGGKLVTPHLARRSATTRGSRARSLGRRHQVLKPETTLEVSRMLTKVVDESLANGTIKTEHYSVAAKTGTAQIANPAEAATIPTDSSTASLATSPRLMQSSCLLVCA
jgi:cell division protein FtsI (penicillin-binding protein 3)